MTSETLNAVSLLVDVICDGAALQSTDVHQFIREIAAPSDLRGIVDVALNLTEIFRGHSALLGPESREIVERWTRICDRIVAIQNEVLSVLPGAKEAEDKRRLQGLYTRHPIYAMLWHTAALQGGTPGSKERLQMLQALCLVWYIVAGFDIKSSHVRTFSLEVRRLSETGGVASLLLPQLPDEAQSAEEYVNGLRVLEQSMAADPAATKTLRALIRMLESILGDPLITRDRTGGDGGTGGGPGVGDRYIIDEDAACSIDGDDDEDEPVEIVTRIYREATGSGRARHPSQEDCNEIERARPESRDPLDSGHLTVAGYEMEMRYRHAAIDRHRNVQNTLASNADSSVLHWLRNHLLLNAPTSRAEAVKWLLALVLLASGRQPGSFKKLAVYGALPKHPRPPYLDFEAATLVLPQATGIRYRKAAPGNISFRPVTDRVELALPMAIVGKVWGALCQIGVSRRNSQFSFSDSDDLDGIARDWARAAGKELGCRVTVGGIRRAVYNAIANQADGGEVLAAMICDRVLPTVRNPMHYRWRSEWDLRMAHGKIFVFDNLSGGDVMMRELGPLRPEDRMGTGARVVPVKIGDYVAGLIATVRAKQGKSALVGVIDHHNTYTLYLSELLYFTTGHRPVHHAFSWREDFDFRRKTLLISDKDKPDPRNTRLVPLIDVACRALAAYRRHVDQLDKTLVLFLGREARRARNDRPYVFYLDPEQPVAWTTRGALEIENLRKPFLGRVANIQRHWLSSRLSELGCPDTYICAFLGHWHSSMSPYCSASAASVKEVMTILREYLEEIASEAGWEAIDAY